MATTWGCYYLYNITHIYSLSVQSRAGSSMNPSFTSPSKLQLHVEEPMPYLTLPIFLNQLEYLDPYPYTLSSNCFTSPISSISRPQSSASSPEALHDTPIVAPTPLPYHVGDFTSFDFTPVDCVAASSLPRYSLKRKRVDDAEYHQRITRKRSALLAPWPSSPPDDVVGGGQSSSRTRRRRNGVRR